MALNTTDSLSHLATTFQCLEKIVLVFDTAQTREAVATARALLRDFKSKKKKQLDLVDAADAEYEQPLANSCTQLDNNELLNLGFDLDFGAFFANPFL